MDGLRLGRQYRALRIRQRKRQTDLATESGLSRSLIAAIDRGQIGGVTIQSLIRATAPLGADVDVRLRWRGEQLDRLLDQDHALVVEAVVSRLRRAGWAIEVEASFNIWGERGSIDVLAFHPEFGALLVIECKSVVPDSQSMLHALDRKTRLAAELGKARGWKVLHTSRLLVVASAATARRRVTALEATYGVAFPARAAAARTYLRRPIAPINGLLFVSIDSHDGARPRSAGRQRVRKRKQSHSITQDGD